MAFGSVYAVFVVHFFVPAGVGHVEGGLLTDKVLEKERRPKRARLTCGKESERRCRLYILRTMETHVELEFVLKSLSLS